VLHKPALYKLIFLSGNPKGLEVFRDGEAKILGAHVCVAQYRRNTGVKNR
jgi:hypothetical protein